MDKYAKTREQILTSDEFVLDMQRFNAVISQHMKDEGYFAE